MYKHDCITLNDIGLTQYELMNGEQHRGPSARWYWDPRYVSPGKEEDTPLDERILKDIDRALDTRIKEFTMRQTMWDSDV